MAPAPSSTPRGDRVIGMRRQRRVADALDAAHLGRARVATRRAFATWRSKRSVSVRSPRSASQAPNGSVLAPWNLRSLRHLGDLPRGARHHAAHHVAVAGEILGARVDRQGRAERERPLQQRRREGGVDQQRHAAARQSARDRVELGDAQQRIGDRLDEDRAGRRLIAGSIAAAVASATKVWATPKRGRIAGDQLVRAAVEALDADHVRRRSPSVGLERRRDRAHARAEHQRLPPRLRARRPRAPARSSVGLASRE